MSNKTLNRFEDVYSDQNRRQGYRLVSSGFTIVELLVVIVVIGILAAISLVAYTGISSRATAASLQSDLENATKLLKLDQVSNSMYPANLNAANGGKGIPSSSGTNYTYAVSNTTNPQTFCITATKNNTSYNITQDGISLPGICPVLNLDAGNIASYPGTGTTWTDLSGNGNSGTLNGGVTYSAGNGGFLNFDGTSGYAAIPNTTLGNGNLDWTVSAWIKTTTAVNALGQGSVISNSASGPVYSMMGVNSGKMVYWTYQSAAWSQKLGNATVNNGSWQNLTWVNHSNNTMDMYVNGVFDANIANSTSGNSNPVDRVGGSWAGYFAGQIANVAIYTGKAFTATETLQNFNNLRSRYGL